MRACTRLLRLLAATRYSWHSYLNVISMFLRTARSYPCTHYVASPTFQYISFNRHSTAVNSVDTTVIFISPSKLLEIEEYKKKITLHSFVIILCIKNLCGCFIYKFSCVFLTCNILFYKDIA